MSLENQVLWLFILALPVACIAWTVTHEEIFAEPHAYCVKRSKESKSLLTRKFFYLFTCEYCFSHYVSILFLFITKFKVLLPDWRGYLIAGFALVFIANVYMSLYARIRIDIKKERIETEVLEADKKDLKK
ncbi:hypothetical protein BH09BAC3_BH09BAC3_16130 [soil metagenome]